MLLTNHTNFRDVLRMDISSALKMIRGVHHHNLAGTFLSHPYKKYINRRNEPGGLGGYNQLDKINPKIGKTLIKAI